MWNTIRFEEIAMQGMGLILILVAGYFLLKQTAPGAGGDGGGTPHAGAVQFYNAAGAPIAAANCGDTIGFDVAGFQDIWLVQTKDGMIQFDGPFSVPMQPYQLSCAADVGHFIATAYQLAAGGPDPGPLIGQAELTVSPNATGGNGGTDIDETQTALT
jgi:hypothetical protein